MGYRPARGAVTIPAPWTDPTRPTVLGCPRCLARLAEGARFCERCGAPAPAVLLSAPELDDVPRDVLTPGGAPGSFLASLERAIVELGRPPPLDCGPLLFGPLPADLLAVDRPTALAVQLDGLRVVRLEDGRLLNLDRLAELCGPQMLGWPLREHAA